MAENAFRKLSSFLTSNNLNDSFKLNNHEKYLQYTKTIRFGDEELNLLKITSFYENFYEKFLDLVQLQIQFSTSPKLYQTFFDMNLMEQNMLFHLRYDLFLRAFEMMQFLPNYEKNTAKS